MQFEYDPENLISEISKRPGLWDIENPDYRTREVRHKLWTEVVKSLMPENMKINKAEMRELEIQLQKKWKSIRDYYVKFQTHKRRTRRPYMYDKLLKFLDKSWKKKNESKNENVNDDDSESEDDSKQPTTLSWKCKKMKVIRNDDGDDDDSTDDDSKDNFDNHDDGDDSSEANTSQKKKKILSPSKTETSIPSRFAFANVDTPLKTDSDDPEKMFLLSLLPHLKTIPQQFRLNVQMELMQVLHNASYSINSMQH